MIWERAKGGGVMFLNPAAFLFRLVLFMRPACAQSAERIAI